MDAKTLVRARRWCRAEFNKQYDWVRGGHPSHLAAKILAEAETRFGLDTFGVEGWACDCAGRRGVSYLNTGDTYATTLAALSDSAGVRFTVTSWGTLAEGGPWRP